MRSYKTPKGQGKENLLARAFLHTGSMTDLAQLIATVQTAQAALRRCYTVIEGKKIADVTRVSNAMMLSRVKSENPIAHATLSASLHRPSSKP